MPIFVDDFPPVFPSTPAVLGVVKAGAPRVEGCPVLLRTRAFIVDQATSPIIEHQVRGRSSGAPVNLSTYVASAPVVGPETTWPVSVRLTEWFAGPTAAPVILQGYAENADAAAAGLLRVDFTEEATALAGIYRLDWGIRAPVTLKLVAVDRTFVFIEFSNFGDVGCRQGPPTIAEVRMAIRDSDAAENFTLDDVECGDEQIVWAMTRPIELWNNETPRFTPYDSTSYPFRDPWLEGAIGFTFEALAQGYRRDAGLVTGAGGVTSQDKMKEPVYSKEAQRRIEGYRRWVMLKKNELQMARMNFSVGSPYGMG